MTQADAPKNPAQDKRDDEEVLRGDLPHRPADDREEIYFQGTPLFRAEIGRIVVWGAVGLALIGLGVAALVFGWIAPPLWWATIPLFLLGLLAIVIPPLQLKAMRYRVTNYRIDFERGLLNKQIDTLELWHVDDISYEQGVIDRMLGVGTITVMSNDKTTPKLTLHGISKPRFVFDSLKQRIIAVKRQRGVIKMDMGS